MGASRVGHTYPFSTHQYRLQQNLLENLLPSLQLRTSPYCISINATPVAGVRPGQHRHIKVPYQGWEEGEEDCFQRRPCGERISLRVDSIRRRKEGGQKQGSCTAVRSRV